MNHVLSEGLSNIGNALRDVLLLNAPETHEIEVIEESMWLKLSANKTKTITIAETIPPIKRNDIIMFWYLEREFPVMRLVTNTDTYEPDLLTRRITVAPHL